MRRYENSKPVDHHADREPDEQHEIEQRRDSDKECRAAEMFVMRRIGDGAGGDQREGDDLRGGFHRAERAPERDHIVTG